MTDGDPEGQERSGDVMHAWPLLRKFPKLYRCKKTTAPQQLFPPAPYTHTLLQLYTATQVIWDES